MKQRLDRRPPSDLERVVRQRNGKREGEEIRFQCPYPERHKRGDAHASARYHPDKAVWCCDVCGAGGGWKDLCELLGVPVSVSNMAKPEIVARYLYRDEDGTVLRRKLRWQPGFGGRDKSFSWEKPDGNAAWAKCKGDGNPRKLYGSEKLPEARESGRVVYVVEGEKDCESCARIGALAVCNPEGAAQEKQRPKWKSSYSEQLRGLQVVIIPDKDAPGRAHAEAVAKSLGTLATSVRYLELPGQQVKDVSDWLASPQHAGTNTDEIRAELEQLAAEAPQWSPTGEEETASTAEKAQPGTQAQLLIELTADAFFFHSSDETPYATVSVNGHEETWAVRSRSFRRWLVRRFFERTAKPPNAQALKDTLDLLEAKAEFDGREIPVFTRLAEQGETIYLDLGNEQWESVAITADGWRVVGSCPVKFRRTKGMLSLCRPLAGGSVKALQRFINVPDDSAFQLVVAWLLAALRPSGPYPILVLQGEQGSAKTTTARMLRSLVDPSGSPVRTMPRDERDLMIAAQNAWVLAFDNLSGLPHWLSDALCRLATGGGFSTRQLYTDAEEILFDAQRPVLLNGIEDLTTRQDLLDRAVIVNLPPIPETKRCTEKALWRAFEVDRPKILGALCNAVSAGLRNVGGLQLASAPRMADFAQWVVAAEPRLPWPCGEFLRAYGGNREEAVELALESDPVAVAVRELANQRGSIRGTAQEVLEALESGVSERIRQSRSWPKSPRGLSGCLRRAAPALRNLGVEVHFDRECGRSRRRVISVENTCSQPSEPSEAAVGMAQVVENAGVSCRTVAAAGGRLRTVADGCRTVGPPPESADGKRTSDGSDGSDAKNPGFSSGIPETEEELVL